MTMHLVRGMTSLNTKKRKGSNSKRLAKAHEEHEAWLASIGVKGRKSKKGLNDIPDYSTNNTVKLGNSIPANSAPKKTYKYSGDYVKGVAVTHKSNLMPVTSREQAIEVSNMRRN